MSKQLDVYALTLSAVFRQRYKGSICKLAVAGTFFTHEPKMMVALLIIPRVAVMFYQDNRTMLIAVEIVWVACCPVFVCSSRSSVCPDPNTFFRTISVTDVQYTPPSQLCHKVILFLGLNFS